MARTNLVYTVTLDHASAFDTTMNYSVGGTATEGSDYTGTTTHSITILAGQTSGTITVDPTADTTFENNETVDRHADRRQHQRARRSASTRATAATGTITNDDAMPTASIAVAPASVLEDGATNLVYTVTLDHASAFDTTVNYSVGGTATEGSDYTGTTTHSITILAGQTSGTITVDPTADTTFENNETVDRHADRRQHQRPGDQPRPAPLRRPAPSPTTMRRRPPRLRLLRPRSWKMARPTWSTR